MLTADRYDLKRAFLALCEERRAKTIEKTSLGCGSVQDQLASAHP